MLEYRAELPWGITQEDVDRLRGLGEVKYTLVIEGKNREAVIRELSDENAGWHHNLGDPAWWQDNLSRGRKMEER